MSTQDNENIKDDDVVIIDLTEDAKHNETITLDDSIAPTVDVISCASSSSNNDDDDISNLGSQPTVINFDQSPALLLNFESDSDCEMSTASPMKTCSQPVNSSHLDQSPNRAHASRMMTSPRIISSLTQSPIANNSNKRKSTNSNSKSSKSMARDLNKRLREEARQLKLKQKEAEKLQKEANRANAANKALNNCTATMDRSVLDIIGDSDEITIRTLFDESMAQYRLTEYPKIENCITWSYRRTEVVDGECVPIFTDSDWMIIVMNGKDYLNRLLDYRDDPDQSNSIKSHLVELKQRTKLNIVLMVFNLTGYLKSERLKDAKTYRKTFKERFEKTGTKSATSGTVQSNASTEPVCGQSTGRTMNLGTQDMQDLRLMLEMELMQQFRDWKLHIEFHEKTCDIVQAYVRYTHSVAKLDLKRKTKTATGLDWAINMDKERAVDPSKSSEDLTKLWVTQLQQFSQVTLPIAKAISAEYPSPCALLDQYSTLTEEEAEGLLAELYVQRNLRRQIGMNISRRVHKFMTSKDPDIHIGIS